MQRTSLARSLSWLAFLAGILWAWWFLYGMATGMGLDLIGRQPSSDPQAREMRGDLREVEGEAGSQR